MKICTEFFKSILLENVEYCGVFEYDTDRNCLVPDMKTMNVGSIEETKKYGRASCNQLKIDDTETIWHTHPVSSKSYPSREDIFKVLKHEEINTSIIFTRWGIWNISFYGKAPIKDYEKESKYMNEFEKLIYEHTDRGRGTGDVDIDYTVYINRYIYKVITRYPGLTIMFNSWDDVGTDFFQTSKSLSTVMADFGSYIQNLLINEVNIDPKYIKLLIADEPLKTFKKAFTHRTADPVNNYEILEFIGDGIIKGINSQYIQKKYGEILKKFVSKKGTSEGAYSKTRRYFESEDFLWPMAFNLGMWEYVSGDDEVKTQDRNRTLGDVFEAFVGALVENMDKYIYDGFGYMFAKKFLEKQLDKQTIEITPELLDDPITRLNELYKASVLKNGKSLRWGDADYDFRFVYIPIVYGKGDPDEYKNQLIFDKITGNVYFSDGSKWMDAEKMPVGLLPSNPITKSMGKNLNLTEINANIDEAVKKALMSLPPEDRKLDIKNEDDKKKFQQYFQGMSLVRVFGNNTGTTAEIAVLKEMPHSKTGGRYILGQGLTFKKEKAKKSAAQMALNNLKKMGYEKEN